MKINFTLNGKAVSIDTNPVRRLLDVLREDFEKKGVKEGCGEGECGACAILLDGEIVNSCLIPIGAVQGCKIVTIEGFQETEKYEVISEAFTEAGAVQCGFCTPGMIIATEALFRKDPNPTPDKTKEFFSGNLCRCTGMNMILEAVEIASRKGEGLW